MPFKGLSDPLKEYLTLLSKYVHDMIHLRQEGETSPNAIKNVRIMAYLNQSEVSYIEFKGSYINHSDPHLGERGDISPAFKKKVS